jgi:hypothetical protein
MNFEFVHNDTDATYGTPPITKELKEAGVSCSRNRVARNPVWDVNVIALTILQQNPSSQHSRENA